MNKFVVRDQRNGDGSEQKEGKTRGGQTSH